MRQLKKKRESGEVFYFEDRAVSLEPGDKVYVDIEEGKDDIHIQPGPVTLGGTKEVTVEQLEKLAPETENHEKVDTSPKVTEDLSIISIETYEVIIKHRTRWRGYERIENLWTAKVSPDDLYSDDTIVQKTSFFKLLLTLLWWHVRGRIKA